MSIESLRYEQRSDDLSELIRQDQQKHKKTTDEKIADNSNKIAINYPFYCDDCLEDFESSGIMYRHNMFGSVIAVYRAKCECGKESIRHVTGKSEDTYYQKSSNIRRQRNIYRTDILQENSFGYRICYTNPYEAIDRRLEQDNEQHKRNQLNRGFKL